MMKRKFYNLGAQIYVGIPDESLFTQFEDKSPLWELYALEFLQEGYVGHHKSRKNASIVYVQNTKGTRNEYRDSDTETLQHYFSQLDSYEREFWEVNAFDCRDNGHIIYWNDSTFNFVSYHCMSKEQKIWHLDRNIKEWFEQKFNKAVHKQQ